MNSWEELLDRPKAWRPYHGSGLCQGSQGLVLDMEHSFAARGAHRAEGALLSAGALPAPRGPSLQSPAPRLAIPSSLDGILEFRSGRTCCG